MKPDRLNQDSPLQTATLKLVASNVKSASDSLAGPSGVAVIIAPSELTTDGSIGDLSIPPLKRRKKPT